MKAARSILWAALALSGMAARAEEFPFENGGTTDAEFEKGFGKEGISEAEKFTAEADRLKIGGALAADFYLYRTDGTAGRDYLLNPNTLWLYLDSRLRNDIRGYVKAKAVFDPTADGQTTSPLTGAKNVQNQSDLEEMKVLFNVKKDVFFTLGKQKIKWGSGRFWNPTDVLNATKRDFLYADDRRSGVTLVKTHLPVGAANLYLVNSLDGAAKLGKVGNAVRAEVPIASSEIALTAANRPGGHSVWGADVSAGIWDFDVYSELAYAKAPNQIYYNASGAFSRTSASVNWVTGVSYERKYSDSDTVTLGLEYFRNGDGYANKADYGWPLAKGAYTPFDLSRQYGMFMIYLPAPGSWNDVSFTLFNVLNLTDRSALSKLNASIKALQDLQIELGLSVHYGDSAGELRLGNQRVDVSTRVMIQF
jgi:hypothetical protein